MGTDALSTPHLSTGFGGQGAGERREGGGGEGGINTDNQVSQYMPCTNMISCTSKKKNGTFCNKVTTAAGA